MTTPTVAPAAASPAVWRAVELLALTGMAVAQPVLGLYRANPLELISREVEGAGPVLAFVALVVLGPPALLLAIEQVVSAVAPRWVEPVHRGVLAALLVALVLQVVPDGSSAGPLVLVVAVAGAVVVWRAVLVRRLIRTWIRLLAVLPLVVSVVFLTSPDISALAFTARPAAATGGEAQSPPSVLLVVLDELPTLSLLDEEGRIDRVHYPSFARLADSATWYRENRTVASWTALAVPALVTGRYPPELTNQAHWTKYPQSLFSLLDGSHRLVVREMNTRLCAASACPARPARESVGDLVGSAAAAWFDRLSPFTEAEVDFVPAGRPLSQASARDVAVGVAAEVVATPGPVLGYAHLELPHQPWLFLPDGDRYGAPHPPAGGGGDAWDDAMAAASAGQRHLLQLGYADRVLGEVLDVLEAADRFDDTLIVVAADHGVSFRPGVHHRALTEVTTPDIAYTPLFIKAPGQVAGQVADVETQTVDVLPTLASLLGVEVPWAVDGVDLTAGDPDRASRFYPVWIDEVAPGPEGWVELPPGRLLDVVAERGPQAGAAARLVSLGAEHPLPSRELADLTVADEVVDGAVEVEAMAGGDRPAYVELRVSETVEGDLALVVAGRVVVTGSLGGPDGRELWAVVPELRGQEEVAQLEVYVVSGPRGAPVLGRLPRSDA